MTHSWTQPHVPHDLKGCRFPVTLGDFEDLNVNKRSYTEIKLKEKFMCMCLRPQSTSSLILSSVHP